MFRFETGIWQFRQHSSHCGRPSSFFFLRLSETVTPVIVQPYCYDTTRVTEMTQAAAKQVYQYVLIITHHTPQHAYMTTIQQGVSVKVTSTRCANWIHINNSAKYEGGPKNNRNLNVARELEVVARCAARCRESTQYSSSLPRGVNLGWLLLLLWLFF